VTRWVLSQLQVDALSRLASVADAYDDDGLDEDRPEWHGEGDAADPEKVVILSGRGGRTLLTLADALAARRALREVQSNEAAGEDAPAATGALQKRLSDGEAMRSVSDRVKRNEAARRAPEILATFVGVVEAPWREAAALSLRQHSYVSPPGPCLCSACALHRKLLGIPDGG